jgi:hypothetical protein
MFPPETYTEIVPPEIARFVRVNPVDELQLYPVMASFGPSQPDQSSDTLTVSNLLFHSVVRHSFS